MTNQKFINYCKDGNLEEVKRGLQNPRIYPSAGDNEAIKWASEYGHVEVVRELLKDSRVDPNFRDDNYAIILASDNGHLEVVKLLKLYSENKDKNLSSEELEIILNFIK